MRIANFLKNSPQHGVMRNASAAATTMILPLDAAMPADDHSFAAKAPQAPDSGLSPESEIVVGDSPITGMYFAPA